MSFIHYFAEHFAPFQAAANGKGKRAAGAVGSDKSKKKRAKASRSPAYSIHHTFDMSSLPASLTRETDLPVVSAASVLTRPEATLHCPRVFASQRAVPASHIPLDEEGRRHGRSLEPFNSLAYTLTDWVHGEKHGVEAFFHLNGEMFHYVEFKNGLRNGLCVYWQAPSGCVDDYTQLTMYGECKDDEPHGWILNRDRTVGPGMLHAFYVGEEAQGTAYMYDTATWKAIEKLEFKDGEVTSRLVI